MIMYIYLSLSKYTHYIRIFNSTIIRFFTLAHDRHGRMGRSRFKYHSVNLLPKSKVWAGRSVVFLSV